MDIITRQVTKRLLYRSGTFLLLLLFITACSEEPAEWKISGRVPVEDAHIDIGM